MTLTVLRELLRGFPLWVGESLPHSFNEKKKKEIRGPASGGIYVSNL